MKVALTAEGTYPHQFGGVSVWCDQLVRRLPQHDFTVVPLVATGNEPMRWQLPANVRSVVPIPLWGQPPSISLRSRLARGRSESMLADLIDVLLSPPAQGLDRFTDVVYELFRYGQSKNLTAALSSETAVRLLAEAWKQRWPEIMPEASAEEAADEPLPAGTVAGKDADHLTEGQALPTLADAVGAMQLLEHALRPLSHPPVQADVVHAVTNGLGALPAFASKWQYGTPMMLTEHGVYMREQYLHNRRPTFGWPVKDLYLRFLRRLCALGYREADLITPGNIYNQRWEIELGADASRIRTVYNGVDPAVFPVVSHEPEVPTISWAGRIDPFKDLETLLRAFSLVAKKIPEAQLRIFGSAPPGGEAYLERCRAEATELGISEQTTFEGRVPEIRDAYAAGHIVVLCSITEGFPYTLIEAMTCGRACVATDVGGVSEAIGDVAGLVVPPRNPAALAEACLRLLRDDELRRTMGAAARARAVEHFTVDRAVDAFDEMYTTLAGAPDRAEAARSLAALAAASLKTGRAEVETGPDSGQWLELPAEEEAAIVAEPTGPQATSAAMADDATQIMTIPANWRSETESEHTLIMPRLDIRSADQADPEQTQIMPRMNGKPDASQNTEQTTQFPALRPDVFAARAGSSAAEPAVREPEGKAPASQGPAGQADAAGADQTQAGPRKRRQSGASAGSKQRANAKRRAGARRKANAEQAARMEQAASTGQAGQSGQAAKAGRPTHNEQRAESGPAASAQQRTSPEQQAEPEPKAEPEQKAWPEQKAEPERKTWPERKAQPGQETGLGPGADAEQTAQFPALRPDVPSARASSSGPASSGPASSGPESPATASPGAKAADAMPADQEPAGVRPARAAEPEQPEVIPHAIWEPGAASDPDETAQFPALKRRLPFIRAGAAARQDPAAPIPADDEDTNAPPELTEARR